MTNPDPMTDDPRAQTVARAIEMLQVAAHYIDQFCPDEVIHYDEADCDGGCVADDCRFVAEDLLAVVPPPPQEPDEPVVLCKHGYSWHPHCEEQPDPPSPAPRQTADETGECRPERQVLPLGNLTTEQARRVSQFSSRWQELFWALPVEERSKLRSLEIDVSRALSALPTPREER